MKTFKLKVGQKIELIDHSHMIERSYVNFSNNIAVVKSKEIMDIEELKGEIITKKRALKIIKNHGNSSFSELKDFIKELGNKKEYEALKVYYFLGH